MKGKRRVRKEEKEEGEGEHFSSTINSLNKYLINAFFMPGTETTMMIKTEKFSALMQFTF